MSIFVYLAAFLAVVNGAGMLSAGFEPFHALVFALALVLGLLGLWKPGPDKADGRVLSVLAMLLAVLPLLREPLAALRLKHRERAHARLIEPMTARWNEERGAFAATVTAAVGATRDGVDLRALALGPLPSDPFDPGGKPCRFWTDGRAHWALVSVGPDRTRRLDVPPSLRATDAADGRARWIAVNAGNFADRLYDPTNGSLGGGDSMWIDGSEAATAAFTRPILEAWSRAERAIGTAGGGDDASEAARTGAVARRLMDDGDPLAALAAATEARARIPPYRAQRKPPDAQGGLVQGEALYALGDPRMAAAALAAYLDFNPNDPRGHYHLGLALYFSGDTAQARRAFAAAYQIDSRHPLAQPAFEALTALNRGAAPPIRPPGAGLRAARNMEHDAAAHEAGPVLFGQP